MHSQLWHRFTWIASEWPISLLWANTIKQGGLSAIIGSITSLSQIQELTVRAKCFYFSRKKSTPIDFDAYNAYLSTQTSSCKPSETSAQPLSTVQIQPLAYHQADLPPAAAATDAGQSVGDKAPYPQSFAQIVDLITSGQPIPGIKEIPPIVLSDQASQPVASKRRKPWEKEVPVVEARGTFGDRRDEVIQQELPEI